MSFSRAKENAALSKEAEGGSFGAKSGTARLGDRSFPVLLGALSLLFTFGLYHEFLRLGYLADDFGHFGAATRVPAWHYWLQGWYGGDSFFRPAARTAYTWQFLLLPSPSAQHALSLLLHAFVAALVARSAWQLTGSRLASLFALGFFLTTPMHAEPVAWLSSQADLWTTLFTLLAVEILVAPGDALGSAPMRRALVAGPCFLLALTFKESAFFLAPLLMGLGWRRRTDEADCESTDAAPGIHSRHPRRRWLPAAAPGAVALVYLVWRAIAVGGLQTAYPGSTPQPWTPGIFAGNVAQLLRQALGAAAGWPLTSEAVRASSALTALQMLLIAAFLMPAIRRTLRPAPRGSGTWSTPHALIALGLAWMVLAVFAPALGSRDHLFPTGQQSHGRLVYLASAGTAWTMVGLLAVACDWVGKSREGRRGRLALGGIVAACVALVGWRAVLVGRHVQPWLMAQAISDRAVAQLALALPRDEPRLLVATFHFPADISLEEGGPEAIGVRSVGEALWIAWGRRPEQQVRTLVVMPHHLPLERAQLPHADGFRVIVLAWDDGKITRMTWEQLHTSWEAAAKRR